MYTVAKTKTIDVHKKQFSGDGYFHLYLCSQWLICWQEPSTSVSIITLMDQNNLYICGEMGLLTDKYAFKFS
jgi:hypothetical protein